MSTITNMKMANDMEILGERIKDARKQRGLLQADVADIASVRRQVIGELERGTYRGSLQRATAILRAMGLRLSIETARFPTLDELSNE